ncbi:MAG: ABC transporter ATP-binding protein [Ignavibacteria bacterium]|nr:ABC transporter ATP-binding protein [Ignavibacteria bacterium]
MIKEKISSLRNLKRLIPYVRKYRARLIWGIVFVTLSNVCSTTIPRVVGKAIDTVRVSNFTDSDILWIIAQILLLTAGSGIFMYATRRALIVMSRFIEEDLRNDFVFAVQHQSQRFFHDRSTGSLIAHFTNDISAVRDFIGPAIMYSCHTITTFAFALSWMISLNVPLTLTILLPVPFITWTTYTIGRKIHEHYKSVQEEYEHITTQAQEAFSGIRVVRAYVREKFESARFNKLSETYYGKNMSLARVNSLMMPAMTVLFNLSYVVVLAMGGYYITTNTLTVGQLTQFFIYLNQLLWPIAMIGWVTAMIQRGSASIGRLGKIMDTVPEILEPAVRPKNDIDLQITKGEIYFKNVTLTYGVDSSQNELENVNLHIAAGTSLGMVGQVGSGKSSLINLIPRLYDPTTGSVEIDGTDIREYSLHVLRSAVSVVPQESFLFSETIAENIRLGNPIATIEQVTKAARLAQIDTEILSLPDGYDTMVGERGVTLSGGQKQRVALARAILKAPSILVLDDSLSAVDTDTEERILGGLREVMENRTTIFISHRISTVKDCTKIVVLQDGKVLESGSHDELIKLDGTYRQMFEIQQLEQAIA